MSDFINTNFKANNSNGYELYISWVHYCLNSILNWRSQEVTLAQSISSRGKIQFTLWGLKQNPQVLLELLETENILYLSHPISEPRRYFKEHGVWPPLVDIINKFQHKLLEHKLPIIMPTSIDEFRFSRSSNNYTAQLLERWPLHADANEMLLRKIN
jgi:hypothetical protein